MMKLTTTTRLERLQDRYRNGGLDRRQYLGLNAAATAHRAQTPAIARQAIGLSLCIRPSHERRSSSGRAGRGAQAARYGFGP